MKQKWTQDKVKLLGKIVNDDHLDFHAAAKKTGFTWQACKRKHERTDWNNLDSNQIPSRPWRIEDLISLYTLKEDAKLTYKMIGGKINRSPSHCESTFQRTDWDRVLSYRSSTVDGEVPALEQEALKAENLRQLAMYMMELSRHNLHRMEEIDEKYFLSKSNMKKEDLPASFKEIKSASKDLMNEMGLGYDECRKYEEGTYLILGDSHGKHTKTRMFSLIKNINSFLKPKGIIHIGHALDDDNDISYLWQDFNNLTIIAKREELETLSKTNKRIRDDKGGREYDICRESIQLGDMTVTNQDMITDYVLTPIGTIKRQLFPDSVVVNMHRHEFDSRTVSDGHSTISSPGCLCEKHIVKTIKQMDFTDGIQVKTSYPDGFIKYRRMRHMYSFWEQGFVVVHIDKDGKAFPVQCRIHMTSKGYTTSYCGTIITENGNFKPDKKVAFNTDVHCRLHSAQVLDVQGQFCSDYKPDVFVNMGDLMRNQSFNHHLMAKNGAHMDVRTSRSGLKFLDESAHTHWLLKKMKSWGKTFKLIYGNHERFAKDLADRLPQLAELLDFGFTTDLPSLGIELIPLKGVVTIGSLRLLHGDYLMFGAKGPKMDKISHTFGQNTVVGHMHYPSIRLGCYMVGLTGQFDQEYNEPMASAWMHGMGYADMFEDKAFISLIHIRDNCTTIGGRSYSPKNPEKWDLPKYKASMSYSFE